MADMLVDLLKITTNSLNRAKKVTITVIFPVKLLPCREVDASHSNVLLSRLNRNQKNMDLFFLQNNASKKIIEQTRRT